MSFKNAYVRDTMQPQELFSEEVRDCKFTLFRNEACYYLKGEGPPEPMLDFFLILHHFSSKESRFIAFVHSDLGYLLKKQGMPRKSPNHFIITREQLQEIRSKIRHRPYHSDVDFGSAPWNIGTLPLNIRDEDIKIPMLEKSPLRVGLPPALQSRYDLVNRLTDGQEMRQVSAIDFAIKSWRAGIYDKLQ